MFNRKRRCELRQMSDDASFIGSGQDAVLLLVGDSCRGGLGDVVRSQATWFSGHGWHVLIAAPKAPSRFASLSPRVHLVDFALPSTARSITGMIRAAAQLRLLIKTQKPQIVHAHGLRSAATCILSRVPFYVTLHGIGPVSSDPPMYHFVRGLGLQLIGRLAIGAFTATPGVSEPWSFLPHASSKLAQIKFLDPVASELPVFAWIGRFADPKRPKDFVCAMAELSKHKKVLGLMAGDGPMYQSIRSLAMELRAPVEFLGWVEDVESVVQRSWAVVLTSGFEALAFTIQEAMWAGRAVVASDLPSFRWLIGDAGYLVKSVNDLVTALSALSDVQHARNMGHRAAERVRRLLSEEAPWSEVEKIFLRRDS